MDRNPPLQDEFDEGLTRLMCQARDGDVQAFSIVYQRCRGRIEVFLFRMLGHRERAEDGTQEVFLKLWLARERYRPTARALSFIFQVARNHALDELRKHRSRPDETGLPEDTDHLPAILFPEGDPQNELLAAYQRWRIRQAVMDLPEPCRAVLVLAYFEELKLSQIADQLEIPLGTVKSRLRTAVQLLRKRLGSPAEMLW